MEVAATIGPGTNSRSSVYNANLHIVRAGIARARSQYKNDVL